MQAPGWPDLYISHRIWSGWLELKIDAPLEAAQVAVLKDLHDRWTPCGVLRWPKRGPTMYLDNGLGENVSEFSATVPVLQLLKELKLASSSASQSPGGLG